ncbi:hypothetical protein GCM10009616_06670 [Microlunatus lacustris]
MSTTVQTEHSSSAPSQRSAEEIWAMISDPAAWPRWNAAVGELALDGPFAEGTTGTLTPPGGNPLPFRLLAVRPGQGYTSETTIASTVGLRSSTSLEPAPDGGLVVTQHSRLVGPAAEHFAPAFGEALVSGVDRTVGRLAGVQP